MGKHGRKFTIEQLRTAVAASRSYRQTLLNLGLRGAGSNYDHVKRYIAEEGISTGHFTGAAWARGMPGRPQPTRALEDLLQKGTHYSSDRLKKRLIVAGLKPPHCEECGWCRKTPEGHLPIELDHINGDKTDNRLENLRVLCPNCHSLKPTYRGRNVRLRRIQAQARVVEMVKTRGA